MSSFRRLREDASGAVGSITQAWVLWLEKDGHGIPRTGCKAAASCETSILVMCKCGGGEQGEQLGRRRLCTYGCVSHANCCWCLRAGGAVLWELVGSPGGALVAYRETRHEKCGACVAPSRHPDINKWSCGSFQSSPHTSDSAFSPLVSLPGRALIAPSPVTSQLVWYLSDGSVIAHSSCKEAGRPAIENLRNWISNPGQ